MNLETSLLSVKHIPLICTVHHIPMYTHNIPLSPTTYPCTHTIYPYPPPHTHVHTQEVKSYPVHCIKVVEKVDEGAFHRKHMFQVVIVLQGQVPNPDTPPEVSLYLQAAVSPYYNIYISSVRCLFSRSSVGAAKAFT